MPGSPVESGRRLHAGGPLRSRSRPGLRPPRTGIVRTPHRCIDAVIPVNEASQQPQQISEAIEEDHDTGIDPLTAVDQTHDQSLDAAAYGPRHLEGGAACIVTG